MFIASFQFLAVSKSVEFLNSNQAIPSEWPLREDSQGGLKTLVCEPSVGQKSHAANSRAYDPSYGNPF